MQGQQQITEIVGKPGKSFGTVFVPTTGTITVKIAGDVIQATVKSGLEKSESWVRIQNIDSVEVSEAPNYALLIFGSLLGLYGFIGTLASFANGSPSVLGLFFLLCGGGCVAWALLKKRRLIAIYSHRSAISVFMTKPAESYRQFATNVIAVARQLNNPVPARPVNNQSPNQRPSNNQNSAQQVPVRAPNQGKV